MNGVATTSPMPKKAPSLPQKRFLMYLQQRVDELGGNITAAGRELDLKQGYVSMLYNGQRNAGPEVIEKAIELHGIARRFFRDYDLGDGEPNYRDFLEQAGPKAGRTTHVVGDAAPVQYERLRIRNPEPTLSVRDSAARVEPDEQTLPTVWIATLKSGRLGQVTDDDERNGLKFCTDPEGGANEGGLTVDDVVDFVEAMRERRVRRQQTASGVAITKAAQDSAAAKGIVPLGKPKPRR
jgi:hypothetical protein